MNILEQYSKTMGKDSRIQLIGELERLANKTFLIKYICGTFNIPFSHIVRTLEDDLGLISLVQNRSSSLLTMVQGIPFIPSHHHFYQWYEEIILPDKGIQKEEDKTE